MAVCGKNKNKNLNPARGGGGGIDVYYPKDCGEKH